MKTLLAIAALLTAVPVQASIVDPHKATIDYCRLREAGEGQQEALRYAILRNVDHSIEAVVLDDGRDLDLALFDEGVDLLCPEWSLYQ